MTKKQDFKISYLHTSLLKNNLGNSRTHSEKQIQQIARSIKNFGFNNPVLIDANNMIIAGHGRVEAAKTLNLEEVPVIRLEHLTKDQVRAFVIADNKLAENAGWDKEILKIEFEYLSELGFDTTLTGFEIPEIDLIINSEIVQDNPVEDNDELPYDSQIVKRVKKGDLWQLGHHRLFCGDGLNSDSYIKLMQDELAAMIFTDPPYNVKIKGNVTTNKKHKEFAQASGEMNKDEFIEFLKSAMYLQAEFSKNGSIHYQCMDWRHIQEISEAGRQVYSELKNICVWDKISAGMGSLYRSQHELVFVFKNGKNPHVNNIELGKFGRYRTNVWKYQGMHASNPQSKKMLKLHPTVKPVALIMEAILDCSNPNDIVLDSFGGSGSTLIAAEKTRRQARIIEIEPCYCDVILYRWENLTSKKAIKLEEVSNERK